MITLALLFDHWTKLWSFLSFLKKVLEFAEWNKTEKKRLIAILAVTNSITLSKHFRCSFGLVVITTAQLHSTKPVLGFCVSLNPAYGTSDGESLSQWSPLSSVYHSTKILYYHHHHYQAEPGLKKPVTLMLHLGKEMMEVFSLIKITSTSAQFFFSHLLTNIACLVYQEESITAKSQHRKGDYSQIRKLFTIS